MTDKRHILLTGLPGAGKTTLIKKIYVELVKNNVPVSGFYTEELRNETSSRIGFDIVSLTGTRDKLARNRQYVKPAEMTKYNVGQYIVYPENVERITLPLIKPNFQGVLIIDEIGKMELFSDNFRKAVEATFKESSETIVATIPVAKGRPIQFVEELRNNPHCHLITVDKSNRNSLLESIVHKISSNS